MYKQASADEIWNRACMGRESTSKAGDSALEAMIHFHSAAMNGGVLHSIECWSSDELEAIKNGYRHFGIDEISALIATAQAALQQGVDKEVLEETLGREYAATIPDDATLVLAFEAHYKSHPESYAPLARD